MSRKVRDLPDPAAERGLPCATEPRNGAYTAGWGEPDDPHRWPRIVNRTIVALARDVRHGGTLFGIELGGRVRLRRIGFLGHSLSGFNSARRAVRRAREDDPLRIARGLGALSALFLLARSQARAWSTCRARWSSAPATPTPEQPDGAT